MAEVQENVVITESDPSKYVVNKCCFFVPLRTGCLILAYLQMVASFMFAAFAIVGIVSLMSFYMHLPEEHRSIAKAIITFNIVSILVNVITIPFNILLVVGLHTNKRNYIKIYLIFGAVQLTISTLQHVAILAIGYASFSLIGLFVTLAIIALTTYFLFVLWSHYVKMVEIIDSLPAQHYRDGQMINTSKT